MKRGMERMCLHFQIVTGLNGSSDVPVSCRDLTNGCCEQRQHTIQNITGVKSRRWVSRSFGGVLQCRTTHLRHKARDRNLTKTKTKGGGFTGFKHRLM